MTEADRKKLLDALENSRDEMGAALAKSGVERASEGWNALQIAEHVTISEQAILNLVTERLSVMAPNPRMRLKIKFDDENLYSRVSRPEGTAESPESMRPANRYKTLAEASAAFAQARTLTIEYVAASQDDLRERVFPHPALGPLDGVQWLLFQAAHASRHARQLERLGVRNQIDR